MRECFDGSVEPQVIVLTATFPRSLLPKPQRSSECSNNSVQEYGLCQCVAQVAWQVFFSMPLRASQKWQGSWWMKADF